MIAGVAAVAFKATSVTRLITRPGAVSMNIDASPATGRNPRAVVPMNAASCGWSASRNTYVRRVTSAMVVATYAARAVRATGRTGRRPAAARARRLSQLREPLPQRIDLRPRPLELGHD